MKKVIRDIILVVFLAAIPVLVSLMNNERTLRDKAMKLTQTPAYVVTKFYTKDHLAICLKEPGVIGEGVLYQIRDSERATFIFLKQGDRVYFTKRNVDWHFHKYTTDLVEPHIIQSNSPD